ncbi:MAG TPA: cytidine deaminase [Ignavibacteriales bacterium]|jgi:cytidine deaminase|nr:cytidine deaminase [Ignavibacteriales bacterium]
MTNEELAKLAIEAKQNAYPPYSKFHVGAALLTKDGKVYKGCNVEISSYGLTMCAERTAAFKAYSEGEREFTAIAISSDYEGFTPPCGACRQVLWDLCGDIDFIMVNHKNELKVMKMSELMPFSFGSDMLNEEEK